MESKRRQRRPKIAHMDNIKALVRLKLPRDQRRERKQKNCSNPEGSQGCKQVTLDNNKYYQSAPSNIINQLHQILSISSIKYYQSAPTNIINQPQQILSISSNKYYQSAPTNIINQLQQILSISSNCLRFIKDLILPISCLM